MNRLFFLSYADSLPLLLSPAGCRAAGADEEVRGWVGALPLAKRLKPRKPFFVFSAFAGAWAAPPVLHGAFGFFRKLPFFLAISRSFLRM